MSQLSRRMQDDPYVDAMSWASPSAWGEIGDYGVGVGLRRHAGAYGVQNL